MTLDHFLLGQSLNCRVPRNSVRIEFYLRIRPVRTVPSIFLDAKLIDTLSDDVLKCDGLVLNRLRICIKGRARRPHLNKKLTRGSNAATAAPTQCILPVTARTTVTANTAQKALLHKKARFCSGSSRLTVFHQYQIASMKISRIISLGIADWLH